MKKAIQAFLQRMLGFETYLYLFARVKIASFHWESRRKEGDFIYFLHLLQPQDHVLDIGANIGIMTTLLARRCPAGIVHAFEPVPDNIRTLKRIIRHYHLTNVQLHPVALGAEKGSVVLRMPVIQGVRMQGLSHVEHPAIEGFEGENHSSEAAVLRLDDLFLPGSQRVAGIKLDVENYEQFVLRGGLEMIARDKPLIYCELWDNDNRQVCLSLMRGAGYEICVLDGDRLQKYQPGQHLQQNFFFVPENVHLPAK